MAAFAALLGCALVIIMCMISSNRLISISVIINIIIIIIIVVVAVAAAVVIVVIVVIVFVSVSVIDIDIAGCISACMYVCRVRWEASGRK